MLTYFLMIYTLQNYVLRQQIKLKQEPQYFEQDLLLEKQKGLFIYETQPLWEEGVSKMLTFI